MKKRIVFFAIIVISGFCRGDEEDCVCDTDGVDGPDAPYQYDCRDAEGNPGTDGVNDSCDPCPPKCAPADDLFNDDVWECYHVGESTDPCENNKVIKTSFTMSYCESSEEVGDHTCNLQFSTTAVMAFQRLYSAVNCDSESDFSVYKTLRGGCATSDDCDHTIRINTRCDTDASVSTGLLIAGPVVLRGSYVPCQ